MIALLLSFVERLGPRLAIAFTMVIAAMLLPADMVGIYTWATLIYGLLQSVFDAAARQVAVNAVAQNSKFLGFYVRLYGTIGPIIMALMISVLVFTYGQIALDMIPFVAAPLVVAVATPSVAKLQFEGQWKVLATGQSFSSVFSTILCCGLLAATHQLWVIAFQVLLIEFLNMSWVIWRARFISVAPRSFDESSSEIVRTFVASSGYSIFSWGQTQGDRFGVGLVAGAGTLASYNFASALSRTAAEAIGSSSANVLRSRIVNIENNDSRRQAIIEKTSFQTVLIVSACGLIVTFFAVFVFPALLDDSWIESLGIVPILAGSGIVSAMSYLITVVLVSANRIHLGMLSRIIGILLIVPISFSVLVSLKLAAILVLFREIVIFISLLCAAKEAAPWKSAFLAIVVSSAFALPSFLGFGF